MAGIGRFPAVVVEAAGVPAAVVEIGEEDLGEGSVLIEISHSSLNYKDGLAATASAPIARRYPMVIGVDLAGTVIESEDESIEVGSSVLVCGCGLSEEHPGGYTRYARVPAAWCTPLPKGLDAVAAMALGTAGLTAMLCIEALERNGVVPGGALPLIVTGAAGGVGSLSVLLAHLVGYRVTASTGRLGEAGYLRELGADEVIGRDALAPAGRGPLGPSQFAGAIDVVGGAILAEVIRRIEPNGAVAACGLAGGAELSSTVYPFILRGVTLAGVNSVQPPAAARDAAWQRLGTLVDPSRIASFASVEPLSALERLAPAVLAGEVRGRVVLDVRA